MDKGKYAFIGNIYMTNLLKKLYHTFLQEP